MLELASAITDQTGTSTMGDPDNDASQPMTIAHPFRLEAITIGSTAARGIPSHGAIGTVHSVFNRVVNILIPGHRLISVVREDVGNGPLNIVTDLPDKINMTEIGIRTSQPVMRADNAIIVGDRRVVISLKNAKRWKTPQRFREPMRSIEEIRENLARVKRTIRSVGCVDGLARVAVSRTADLLKAIRAENAQDINECARALIGLGPGLTPSADDMLSGLMASMIIVSRNLGDGTRTAQKVITAIASCVRGQTTLISQESLLHAAAGETSEPVTTLIKTLLTAEPDKVAAATRTVIAIGATSGTNTVLGILLGAQVMLDTIEGLRKNY